jgi:hypothetical protein
MLTFHDLSMLFLLLQSADCSVICISLSLHSRCFQFGPHCNDDGHYYQPCYQEVNETAIHQCYVKRLEGFSSFFYRSKGVCGYSLPGNYKVLHTSMKSYKRHILPEVEKIRSMAAGNGGTLMNLWTL